MLKGIVFDLDGTLVDSLPVTLDGFNYAIEALGRTRLTYTEIMAHFGLGEDKIFEKLVGPENSNQAYDLFKQYTQEHISQIPLHTGVDFLLEKIQRHQIPTSIVTGRSWHTTEVILRHHGIFDSFISIIAHDHVKKPKPSPEGIHLALEKMRLSPEEVFYVGDSTVDIQACHSAGSHSIAALWDSLAHKSALEIHEPQHWAKDPLEVWRIWEEQILLT